MKAILTHSLLLITALSFTGCVSVKSQRAPSTRSTVTTTEESTVRNPRSTTVETQTTRNY